MHKMKINNRLLKNKRGQFYILAAIMLVAVSTTLLTPNIITPESSSVFSKVFQSYEYESNAAINNALSESNSPVIESNGFTDAFINYAKVKKMQLEVFSVLIHDDMIYTYNKMDSDVEILGLNITIASGQQYSLSQIGLSSLVFELKDEVFFENIYKFSFNNQDTQHYAVLRLKKAKDSEVFVKS